MKSALIFGAASVLVAGLSISAKAQEEAPRVPPQVTRTAPPVGDSSTHSIKTAHALNSCISGSQLFMAAKMYTPQGQQAQNQPTSFKSSIQQLQQQAQKEFQAWEKVSSSAPRGEGPGQWDQDFYNACNQYRQTLTGIVGNQSNQTQQDQAGEQPAPATVRSGQTSQSFTPSDYASITLINHSLCQALKAYEFQQVPTFQQHTAQWKTDSQQTLKTFLTENKIQTPEAGDNANQTVSTPRGQQGSSAQVQKLAQQAQQIITLISQNSSEIKIDDTTRDTSRNRR